MTYTVRYDAYIDLGNSAQIVNCPAPVAPGNVTNKSYVDTAIASIANGISPPTDFDASGNPDYPASDVGDSYIVTVPGKIGGINGIQVEVGDVIYCKTQSAGGDFASAGSAFYIVQTNLDSATTTTKGTVILAQIGDYPANTTKAVTPAILKTVIDNASAARVFSQTIGNGADTIFTINHNLGREYPPVTVGEASGNKAYVIAEVRSVDANNTRILFNLPPTTNKYIVTIG